MMSHKRKRNNSDKGAKHLPPVIKDSIKRLFDRKFVYKNKDDRTVFTLPNGISKLSIQNRTWKIQEYIDMKNELNDLKNNLNDKDMVVWHSHTRTVNLAGSIAPHIRTKFRPELCTQAWCKFYEIASTYLQIETKLPYFSVHLCEAPGAFVTSLNHYLLSSGYSGNWSWLATTLNPYYEGNSIRQMINDDSFIQYSHGNWYFGVDGTGNLMSAENLSGLRDKLQDTQVDLVTADGSIDCQGDPAEQEGVVSRLQYCEAITAMNILSPGGSFVIKMFTMFECRSICLMYLLNCVFEKVNAFKPCTSKGGNSEVYVICLGYKGCESYLTWLTDLYFGESEPEGCIFDMADIPTEFFTQHTQCVEFFKDSQMTCIQRNLDLCKDLSEADWAELEQTREYCLECFLARYHIEPMMGKARIMRVNRWARQCTQMQMEFGDKIKLEGKFTGSFQERQRLSKLPWKQKVFQFETFEEEVERDDNSLWIQSAAGPLQDREILGFTLQTGQPVGRIRSSRLCHDFYIARTQEILDNIQCLKNYTETSLEFTEVIAKRLLTVLSSNLQNVDQTTEDKIISKNSNASCVCDNGICHMLEDCENSCPLRGAVTYKTTDCVDNGISAQQQNLDQSRVHNSEKIEVHNAEATKVLNAEQKEVHNAEPTVIHNAKPTLVHSAEPTLVHSAEPTVVHSAEPNVWHNAEPVVHNAEPTEALCSDQKAEEITVNRGSLSDTSVGVFEGQIKCDCHNEHSLLCQRLREATYVAGHMVWLYCVATNHIGGDFELAEQKSMCEAVTDIIQRCRLGDTVVLEMGSCLSRLTAGLVYLLYRSFTEIGFVHHHGNLLKRHLVCISYQGCSSSLHQSLLEACQTMNLCHPEALLEIVPLYSILEDQNFTSFLHISNSNILQSFITTVINKERQLYTDH